MRHKRASAGPEARAMANVPCSQYLGISRPFRPRLVQVLVRGHVGERSQIHQRHAALLAEHERKQAQNEAEMGFARSLAGGTVVSSGGSSAEPDMPRTGPDATPSPAAGGQSRCQVKFLDSL